MPGQTKMPAQFTYICNSQLVMGTHDMKPLRDFLSTKYNNTTTIPTILKYNVDTIMYIFCRIYFSAELSSQCSICLIPVVELEQY